jgi:signal recognition particle GTPase
MGHAFEQQAGCVTVVNHMDSEARGGVAISLSPLIA